MAIHLVIHGHFYQPPRENPWTGEIERQESAAPFHDWNARIAAECYTPNARSRVLDSRGRIQDIVNNFERLSFNVGPTLLSWIIAEAPDVFEAMLRADGASQRRLGHGNAIAQAYNHMILPLATPRDRQTQIHWGIREFQHRFGRSPEAMWLPETAVDTATLESLVRAGMRYVILSPAQAARWRPMGESRWITPAEAELDSRRPYRWSLRDGRGKAREDVGIDVCFYDAPLSRGISFQHYLRDAGTLASRIANAAAGFSDPLILIATDGESFGHHEKFGDMCLATLFAREAPQREFSVTNLAAYLASHRPTWEVELLAQSAWSCSHGLGRWQDDCGCSAGGGPGWSQRWRRPLREGLDRLRDALGQIFVEEGGSLLADVWAARDDYIGLLLDPSETTREAFFARHSTHPLSSVEQVRVLRLLEMEHQALLMYTSCGWFFSEISGLETVQNLRYAARAIELAEPFAPLDLEAVLLGHLERAQSNVPAWKDGRHVWESQVRPSRVRAEDAVARLLLEGVLGREIIGQTRYRWDLTPEAIVRKGALIMAGVWAVSQVTRETSHFAGACRRDGPFDFLAGIAPWPATGDWTGFLEEAAAGLSAGNSELTAWTGKHAARQVRLRDFLADERRAILEEVLAETRGRLERACEVLCNEAFPAAEAMVNTGMRLPAWLAAMLEATWSRQLTQALEKLDGVTEPARYTVAMELVAQARHLGLGLDLTVAAAWFDRMLVQRLKAIADTVNVQAWQEYLELLRIAGRLSLPLSERALQDRIFRLLRDRLPALVECVRDPREEGYALVIAILAIASRLNLNTDEARDRLRPLEARVAEDPMYWP